MKVIFLNEKRTISSDQRKKMNAGRKKASGERKTLKKAQRRAALLAKIGYVPGKGRYWQKDENDPNKFCKARIAALADAKKVCGENDEKRKSKKCLEAKATAFSPRMIARCNKSMAKSKNRDKADQFNTAITNNIEKLGLKKGGNAQRRIMPVKPWVPQNFKGQLGSTHADHKEWRKRKGIIAIQRGKENFALSKSVRTALSAGRKKRLRQSKVKKVG